MWAAEKRPQLAPYRLGRRRSRRRGGWPQERPRRRARRSVELLRSMKMVTIGGKRLALVAASFIAGSAGPTALVIADSGPPKAVFDEISVKRINIVEPGGKYRLVLANSERFPGLFMEIVRASCRERRG